jgi:hypothetical protein
MASLISAVFASEAKQALYLRQFAGAESTALRSQGRYRAFVKYTK